MIHYSRWLSFSKIDLEPKSQDNLSTRTLKRAKMGPFMVPMMVPGGAKGCQVGQRELFVIIGTLAGVLVHQIGIFEKMWL